MQRRSRGVVQLEWVCPNCQGRNPGPVKTCENCGAPQPENVQFQRAADEKLITDEKVVAAAKAGADIHCGFCGTRNPATATTCSQCGADLKEGKARQAGQVMQAAPAAPKVVTCSNCGSENPGSAKTCSNCGAPIKLNTPVPPQPKMTASAGVAPIAQPKKGINKWVAGGIGAFLLMCCAALIMMFALPTRTLDGTVSSVYWKTSVPVQEVHAVRHSDESGSPPSDAYDVSCRTDSHEVCEDKTIDKGNGYAEVVTDCRTVNEQYCSYTEDEWQTIQTYDLEGYDLNPQYASPSYSTDQRLGSSSADFKVTFSTSDGDMVYSTGSETEFRKYQPGSQWKLKLNAIGSIIGVE